MGMKNYEQPEQTEMQRRKGLKPYQGGLLHKNKGWVKGCDMNSPTLFGSELEMPRELKEWPPNTRAQHGDGDHVFEYESEVITNVPDLATYTKEGLLELYRSGGSIHSYYPRTESMACACDRCAENGGVDWDNVESYLRQSVSNHIHISPHDFRTFNNLFWLTQAFQVFFKNSPYMVGDKVHLSRRLEGRGTEWCENVLPSEDEYYEGIWGRKQYGLTPNEIGTLEYRRNDLSKSPQTVIFLTQLSLIARFVPDFFDSFALDEEIDGDVRTLDEYKDNTYARMMALAQYLQDKYVTNEWFYNYYTGNYERFTTLVKNMAEIEIDLFDSFKDMAAKKRNPYYHWTKKLVPLLAREIPKAIKGDEHSENMCTIDNIITPEYMAKKRGQVIRQIGGVRCVE